MDFPYETSAKRGDPMPDGLSWAEQGHYQAIAALTVRYQNGGMSAEQAVKEKRQIDKTAMDVMSREKYIKHTADLYVDVEWTAVALRKLLNEVPEEQRTESEKAAQKLLDVIYGFFRYTEEEQEQHRKMMEDMKNAGDTV